MAALVSPPRIAHQTENCDREKRLASLKNRVYRSSELSRSGEPWHRIERLEYIVDWFDRWMMGVPHPEFDINPGQPAAIVGVRPAVWGGRCPVQADFLFTISIYLYNIILMLARLNLDATFSALADPTRRAILARLAKGEATVMELAKPFEMTQPAISQHLKVLEDAGLVALRVDGTKRPRRLAKAGIEAMDQWLAMLRKALEKNYDRLDEVLAGMEQPKTKRGEKR